MADYTANFKSLLAGHLGLDSGEGEKGDVSKQSGNEKSTDQFTKRLDLRDAITALVGSGYTSFKHPNSVDQKNIKEQFGRITELIGLKPAQKLMDYVFIFNQKPGTQKQTPEQRVNQFYDIIPKDDEVQKVISGLKTYSRGATTAMNTSGEETNARLTGRFDLKANSGDKGQTDVVKRDMDTKLQ